jgi:hypothetical protein
MRPLRGGGTATGGRLGSRIADAILTQRGGVGRTPGLFRAANTARLTGTGGGRGGGGGDR